MKTYTFTADEKTINEIASYFNKEDFSSPGDYMLYKISRKNLSIIIITSKSCFSGKKLIFILRCLNQ